MSLKRNANQRSYQRLQFIIAGNLFRICRQLRQEEPSFRNKIVAFNLQNVLENPGSSDDLQLMERDQIVIYHKDFRTCRLYIDGAM